MQFLDELFTVQSTEDNENGFTAQLRCNPDHLIYQAHFPGNPITPGACLLQTAGELLQRHLGKQLYLKASKNVKYINVLPPAADKVVSFTFSDLTQTESECDVQVVIADEASVYTKMSLSFSYEAL